MTNPSLWFKIHLWGSFKSLGAKNFFEKICDLHQEWPKGNEFIGGIAPFYKGPTSTASRALHSVSVLRFWFLFICFISMSLLVATRMPHRAGNHFYPKKSVQIFSLLFLNKHLKCGKKTYYNRFSLNSSFLLKKNSMFEKNSKKLLVSKSLQQLK